MRALSQVRLHGLSPGLASREGKEGLAKTYFQQAYDINPAADDVQREVELMRIKKRKSSRFKME